MKKQIIALFAILALIGNVAYAYDADGNANVKRQVDGAPAYFAYREYQLVRYPASGNQISLSAGDVVLRDCISDDGISVNLASQGTSVDAVAGVVVSATIPTADVVGTTAQTDFGRRNWGYIQVKGLCTYANVNGGTATSGSSLIASSTLPRYATASTGSAATTQRLLGFAYDASAQGQSEVDINL